MLTGKQTGTLMEADKNLSTDIRKARSGNNAIAISQASISLSTSLTEPCLYYEDRQSSASMRVTSHQMVSIWRFRA